MHFYKLQLIILKNLIPSFINTSYISLFFYIIWLLYNKKVLLQNSLYINICIYIIIFFVYIFIITIEIYIILDILLKNKSISSLLFFD